MTSDGSPERELPRVLGPGRFALFVVGLTVATAIFRVPSLIAGYAGTPEAAAALWVFGAVFAFAGGLCAAELAVRLPRAGGEIMFLEAAYGKGAGFVYGWTWLLLVSPASIAAVARTVADYAGSVSPMSETGSRLLTVAVVLLHTVLAMASTRAASRFISAATAAKLAAMIIVVAVAFAFPAPEPRSTPLDPGAGSLGSIIAGLVAVIWAYDGSSQATMAGEVRDPARTLPRGFLFGTALIAVIYLLLNAAYARTLGFEGVAGSSAVAADAMGAIAGRPGTIIVAGIVMLSAYSCGMIQLVSHPRVTYAMARDGLFFSRFASLSSHSRTPWVAVALHGALAAVLATTGGYGVLIRLTVFAYYPLLGAAYLGTVVLRRRDGAPAAFRMPLYPLPVVFYTIFLALVMIVSLVDDPAALLYGTAVTAAGILTYRLVVRPRAARRAEARARPGGPG